MNFLVYSFLPVAGSLFILAAQLHGMEQMGMNRQIGTAKRRTAAFLLAAAIVFFSLGPPVMNLAVNLLFFVILPLFGTRLYHSGKKYAVYYLVLAIVVYLTDALVLVIFQYLVGYGILYLNSRELMTVLLICCSRMTEFMVIRLIVWAVRKNNGLDINGRQFMGSLVLPVFSIVNFFIVLTCLQVFQTPETIALFVVDMLCTLGLNIYFAALTDKIGEREKLKWELAFYRQQSEMQLRYYEQEERKYEESRKVIHDIRNHIAAMEELYLSGGSRNAAGYAGEIRAMLNSLGQTYYTSERLLNIIINDKVRVMKGLGIREDIRVGDVDLGFMRETDVTAVFANLLDNGIAAAEVVKGGFIRLRIEQERQFLSVLMENSCPEEPLRREDGSFRSAKPGHRGIGLRNIKSVAEAYEGDAQFEWTDGVFTARILLVRGMGPAGGRAGKGADQ